MTLSDQWCGCCGLSAVKKSELQFWWNSMLLSSYEPTWQQLKCEYQGFRLSQKHLCPTYTQSVVLTQLTWFFSDRTSFVLLINCFPVRLILLQTKHETQVSWKLKQKTHSCKISNSAQFVSVYFLCGWDCGGMKVAVVEVRLVHAV